MVTLISGTICIFEGCWESGYSKSHHTEKRKKTFVTCLMVDGDYIYSGDHFTVHTSVESIHCATEMNMIL